MRNRPGAAAMTAALFCALWPWGARAQDGGPKVGDPAPEFSLKGSLNGALLSKPVRLSDFRGQAVVIAFFPKSRTKG